MCDICSGRSALPNTYPSLIQLSAGLVDMAVGSDQGGSIRIPAALCGIVGLKPTFGLIPFTGAMTLETTMDHLGPMTKTVYDCALLLEVTTCISFILITVERRSLFHYYAICRIRLVSLSSIPNANGPA